MDNKRLFLAFAISIAILAVWNLLFPPPMPPETDSISKTNIESKNQNISKDDISVPDSNRAARGTSIQEQKTGTLKPGTNLENTEEKVQVPENYHVLSFPIKELN